MLVGVCRCLIQSPVMSQLGVSAFNTVAAPEILMKHVTEDGDYLSACMVAGSGQGCPQCLPYTGACLKTVSEFVMDSN